MNPYLAFALFSPIIFLILWTFSIWPLWQSLRDDRNMSKAEMDLPALAKELKLRHKKDDRLGSYSGHWNGHRIRIEPHSYQTSVGIFLKENPEFTASHEGTAEKPPFDVAWVSAHLGPIVGKMMRIEKPETGHMTRFDFGDPVLDKYFQKRWILDRKGEPLVHNPVVRMVMRDYIDRNRSNVKNLTIGAEVSCSLWVGSSTTKTRLYSVTGEQARSMLAELFPIVQAVENAMNSWTSARQAPQRGTPQRRG